MTIATMAARATEVVDMALLGTELGNVRSLPGRCFNSTSMRECVQGLGGAAGIDRVRMIGTEDLFGSDERVPREGQRAQSGVGGGRGAKAHGGGDAEGDRMVG